MAKVLDPTTGPTSSASRSRSLEHCCAVLSLLGPGEWGPSPGYPSLAQIRACHALQLMHRRIALFWRWEGSGLALRWRT
jgi:hypothetical protein